MKIKMTLNPKLLNNHKIINDSIHGHFELSKLAVSIIDTPEFQRLRNLKQLGLTCYVYPGAEHTRFQHCLGTYYLAKKHMKVLRINQPELNISDLDIELVGIAGLCHDLGHGPFSHAFECWVQKKYKRGDLKHKDPPPHHEILSVKILEKIVERTKIIPHKLYKIIAEMIHPDKNKEYDKPYMYQIVCNTKTGIDVDKFDYLLRDSHHTNKPCGFDYNRLIINARVIKGYIAYPDKEVYNIYELFRTRYSMYRQVYLHPVTKSIEFLMMDILDSIDYVFNLSSSAYNVDEYLEYDDSIILTAKFIINSFENVSKIKYIENMSETILLIKRLETRNLYKCIYYRMFDENQASSYNINDIRELLSNKLDDQTLSKIRIDMVRLNYGMSNLNPVENVMFYKSSILNESFNIHRNEVSPLLPNTFIEYHLRIYSTEDHEDIKSKINSALIFPN